MKKNKLRLTLLGLTIYSFCYCQPDTLLDIRDGQVYKTLKIGDQTWMTENLRFIDKLYLTSKNDSLLLEAGYRVGSKKISDKEIEHWRNWENNLSRFALCYNDTISNCEKYGALYTWESANKACPKGWHLPSSEEYDQLFISLGADKHRNFRSSPLGVILRLNFKPGGYVTNLNSARPKFSGLHKRGTYWTSTNVTKQFSIKTISEVSFGSHDSSKLITFLDRYYNDFNANYVRCVKDK